MLTNYDNKVSYTFYRKVALYKNLNKEMQSIQDDRFQRRLVPNSGYMIPAEREQRIYLLNRRGRKTQNHPEDKIIYYEINIYTNNNGYSQYLILEDKPLFESYNSYTMNELKVVFSFIYNHFYNKVTPYIAEHIFSFLRPIPKRPRNADYLCKYLWPVYEDSDFFRVFLTSDPDRANLEDACVKSRHKDNMLMLFYHNKNTNDSKGILVEGQNLLSEEDQFFFHSDKYKNCRIQLRSSHTNPDIEIKFASKHLQSEEPTKRWHPKKIEFREIELAFQHKLVIDINNKLYKTNSNKSKKFSYHYFRVKAKDVWRPKKKIRELQMDYLSKLFTEGPTINVGMDKNVTSHVELLHETLKNFTTNGVDVKVKIPILDDIISKLLNAWNDVKVRKTLLMIAYLLFKGYVTVLTLADRSNPYKQAFSMITSVISLIMKEGLVPQDDIELLLFLTVTDIFDGMCISGFISHAWATFTHSGSGYDVAHYLERYEQMDFKFEDSIDLNTLGPLLQAIYCWMYYMAFSKEYKGDPVTSFLKECSSIKKAKEGAEDFISFLGNCITKLLQILQGQSFSTVFSNNLYPQLDEIATQVGSYMNNFNKGFTFKKSEAEKIIQLSADLDKLMVKIPSSKDFVEYKKKAILLQSNIQLFVKEIKRSGMFDDGQRLEPLGVLVLGPPGVGKSTCMTQLFYELAALTMDDDQYENYKVSKDDSQYTYMPENEYLDRYRKQYFCLVDEFGALKDSPTVPNDGYLFMLRAVNCWPFPVHMADLADKGTMFDSKFIVGISNLKKLDIQSLVEPEAVARRFTFKLLMVPKLEWCLPWEEASKNTLWDRRLDADKLKAANLDINDYSFMEFYKYDIVKGKVISSALEWRAVINEMAIKFLDKKNEAASRLAKLPVISKHCDELRKGFHPQMDTKNNMFYSNDLRLLMRRGDLLWDKFKESVEETAIDATDALIDYKDKLCNTINDIKNYMKSNPYFTAMIASIPLAILAWKAFFPPVKFSVQSVFPKQKIAGKATIRRSPKLISKVGEQICSANTNFDNVVSAVLKSNHYLIKTSKGQRASFTFIKGRIGVFPNHFYSHWMELEEEGEEVILVFTKALSPGSSFEMKFKDIRFFETCKTSDLCFAWIPDVYMHRDISKFLITRDEKVFQGNFHGALARFNNDLLKLHTTEVRCMGSFKYSHYANERSYEYNIATTRGECGEILFSSDSRSTTKILGIHVCGDGFSTGDSVAIFHEDFQLMFDKLCKEEGYKHIQNELEDNTVNIREGQLGLPEKFCPLVNLETLIPSSKNNTIKSPLYEAWGPSDYAPTILREYNGIDPWHKAREGYNPLYKAFDSDLLNLCTESYANVCFGSARKMDERPRVFTFEEAVAGIPGYYKGVPRDTSAGYPLAIDWKGKGKTIPFGKEGDFTFDSEACMELKTEVLALIEEMKQGIRPKFYYMDHLKAERRKKAKVEAMENRLFNASPLHYTIICRMYFGHCTQWLTDEKIFNGIAVGINPFSDEWHRLVHYLKSVNAYDEEVLLGIFGDYKKYDGSFPPKVIRACQKFFHMYYLGCSDEDVLIRDVLFEDVINSRHVHTIVKPGPNFGKSVSYEWYGSVPSGHPLTVFLNSIGNNIMIRYCCVLILKEYHDHYKESEFPDMDYLESRIRIITYGDDNGITVNKDIACITQENLTFYMSLIGMTYTSEDKTAVHLTHRPLEECSFLKCGFRFDNDLHKWVATQNMTSILDMPYWTKSNGKDPLSVQKTVDILLHKLALHGKETFNLYAPAIIEQSMYKMQHKPQYLDYKLNRDAILSIEFEF